jgi:hypothetical protein
MGELAIGEMDKGTKSNALVVNQGKSEKGLMIASNWGI